VIASLSGIVISKSLGHLVVDVHGVGYLVAVSALLETQTTVGESLILHTAMVVREDSMTLFGFSNEAELRVFETLRSVTGVGPKLAMTILAQLGIEKISLAVATQDDKTFSSVTGIGPKTAKLLIVSLEGKLTSSGSEPSRIQPSAVLSALVGLGWKEREAADAIEATRRSMDPSAGDKEILRNTLALLASDRAQSKSHR
jgi:Holliday junction DNA helicase RuvA